MPELSRFFGIIIRMFWEVGAPHHLPHFHVYYQDDTLRVTFDDQTEQTIDFAPVLAGELFGVLQDLSLFTQVRIDPEAHTLVWPNGADFDPATLHDWPRVVDSLRARAQEWESVTA